VILEEAVRQREGEHREQGADEHELNTGRTREESGVHKAIVDRPRG
jgi:hypothetical protein